MNLNVVNQADDLFRRYDLIGIMNRLTRHGCDRSVCGSQRLLSYKSR